MRTAYKLVGSQERFPSELSNHKNMPGIEDRNHERYFGIVTQPTLPGTVSGDIGEIVM